MSFRRRPDRDVQARKREQIRRRRRYQFEGAPRLEPRTLLTIVAVRTSNGATFTGDGAADTLLLRVNPTGLLEYSANGGAYRSDLGGGSLIVGANVKIVADLKGGDDVLGIDASLANALLGASGATLDFKAGAGTDALRGPSLNSTWNLTGGGLGQVGRVSFDRVEALVGGLGRDLFVFDNKPQFDGTVDGGGGGDVLDYSATNRSVSVDLALGTATGLSGFTAIQDVIGGTGTDTLAGPNADNAWRIDGPGSGIVGTSRFSGFENLAGASSRPDVFVIVPGGSLSGGIDGGTGAGDVLDLSALASPSAVTLSQASAGGFAGGGPLGFAGIDEIVGGSGVGDSLTDATGASSASWELNATPSYRSGSRVLRFSGFEALAGGSGADTFLVNGARLERLSGGAGADRIVMADGASLSGPIDGGTGSDTLDLSAYVSPRSVALNGLGSSDGFAGTETSVAAGFTNLDAVLGGPSLNDRLTGRNAAASWDIAVNTLYSSGGRSLNAVGFDSFAGGSGEDTFRLANGTTLQGAIDGGAGLDAIDWSASISPRVATLLGPGSTDGFRGIEPSILTGFDNVETLVGGQSLADRLIGQNANALWNLGATRTYQSGGTLGFSSFEGLTGGSADDTFRVATPPGGLIDGGTGVGVDTLDFSPSNGPIIVSLEGTAAVGFRGSGTVGFVAIDAVFGSLSSRDTLVDRTGSASSHWNLTTEPTLVIGAQTLRFGRIEDLTGGGSAQLASGSVGSNATTSQTLRYDAASKTVRLVNTATAAVVASRVIDPAADNLVRVIGTAGGNTLAIDASFRAAGLAAVFDALGGSDALDLSSYSVGSATALEKSDNQGYAGIGPVAFLGVDRLTASTATGDSLRDQTGAASATWAISAAPSYKSGGRTLAFSGYEALVGGVGADTFQYTDGISLAGSIDGGAGVDVIDWSDYSSTRLATLNGLGAADGFAGSEASVIGGFTNVDSLIGGRASNDRLTGRNSDASWDVAAGGYLSGGGALGFTGFESLVGGSGMDAFAIAGNQAVSLSGGAGADFFTFADKAKLGGALEGGAGADGIDWSNYRSTRNISLNGPGTTDGFAGSEASVAGGFTNIDSLVASQANDDRLTGRNASASWNLASGTYLSGNALGFVGFEDLVGGSGADAFQIAGNQAVTLSGGAGADLFRFEAGAVVTRSIDGGAGTDTLDWSSSTTTRQVSLDGTGNTDGFDGSEASIARGFSNIDAIRGGTGVDRLTGRDTSAIWRVATLGSYENGNATLAFESFEDLVGGKKDDDFTITGAAVANLSGVKGNDVFRFAAGGTLVGLIDGGDGSDSVDWSASSAPRQVALSASGNTDGFSGTEASVSLGFDNIDGLIGGSGTDRLTGLDAQANWDVSGGRYTSGPSIDFSGFEFLIGGSGADRFELKNSLAVSLVGNAGNDLFLIDDRAILGGSIDGGAGTDTIDWSDYRSTRLVSLNGPGTTDGFAGTEATVTAGFSNVDSVIGGRANDDRLTGGNLDASWDLAAGQYVSGNALGFTSFESLVGGSGVDAFSIAGNQSASVVGGAGNDLFTFANGAKLKGDLAGGAGIDLVDFSAFTVGVSVNLASGTSDRVNGSLSGVENATGGSGNDALTGDAGANVLIGGAGRDTILGNAGDDLITDDAVNGGVIDGGPGTDTLVINGTAGADDLTAFNDRITLGTSSANVVSYAGVERLSVLALGGDDALTTSITAGGPITSFDGGLGNDTITAGNVDATWTVTGKHSGTVNTGTLVSYVEVERVLGGQGHDTLVVVVPPIAFPIQRPTTITIKGPRDGSVTPTEPPGPDDPGQPETEFSDIDEIRNPDGPSILDLSLGLFGGAIAIVGGSLILGPKPLPGLPLNPIGWILGGSSVILKPTTPEPGKPSKTEIEILDPPPPGPPPGPPPSTEIEPQDGDSVRQDEDDPDDDDDDDEEECKANYTITATGNVSYEAPDCENVWTINGPNSGTLDTDAGQNTFTGVGTLIGGLRSDRFIINPLGSLSGSIQGGGVSLQNTIEGPAVGGNWSITGIDSGTAPAVAGGFSDVAELIGGLGPDTFQFGPGGSLSGSIDGGGLATGNTLVGPSSGAAWEVNGVDSGLITSKLPRFTNVANLTGGDAGADTFVIRASGFLGGTIDGGADSSANVLRGPNTIDTFWVVDGQDAGSVHLSVLGSAGASRVSRFVHVGRLNGGPSSDYFGFEPAGKITGAIIGGDPTAGENVILGPDVATVWRIDGQNLGSIDDRVATFSQIDVLDAGNAADTFVFGVSGSLTGRTLGGAQSPGAWNTILGPDAATDWRIIGVDRGSIDGRLPSFVDVANLTGGTLADTFHLTSAQSRITGLIDGQRGPNAPAADSQALNTIIGPDVATSWFTGDLDKGSVVPEGTPGTAFQRIGNLTGGFAADTFRVLALSGSIDGGFQRNSTDYNVLSVKDSRDGYRFDVLEAGQGTVSRAEAGIQFGFLEIASLVGSLGNDVFAFGPQGNLWGSIEGGRPAIVDGFNPAPTDVVIGPDLPTTWELLGERRGTIQVPSRSLPIPFTNITRVVGGTAADVFQVSPSSDLPEIRGGVQGAPSTWNTIVGPTSFPTLFAINGTSGEVATIGEPLQRTTFTRFANVSHFQGGDQHDVFEIQGTLPGHVDGGVQTGAADVNEIVLKQSGTIRVTGADSGTSAAIGGGFSNVGTLRGHNSTTLGVELAGGTLSGYVGGPDPTSTNVTLINAMPVGLRWEIGPNKGNVLDGLGHPILNSRGYFGEGFVNVGHLVGGMGYDSFILQAGSALAGRIDGGAGGNVLRADGLGGDARTWQVTGPDSGTVTGIGGGFVQIGQLGGGAGPDTFRFEVGGSLSVRTLDGGGFPEANTLEVATADPGLWFVNETNAGRVVAGPLTLDFTSFGRLVGGSANDRFVVADGARLDGGIDGGQGVNDLQVDAQAYWVISGRYSGAVLGLNTPIVPLFTNVQRAIGGASADTFSLLPEGLIATITGGLGDDALVGPDRPTFWNITGADLGNIDSQIVFEAMEALRGGADDDTFVIPDGVGFNGSIAAGGGADRVVLQGTGQLLGVADGGDNAANDPDVVDLSAVSYPVLVDLNHFNFNQFESVVGNGAGARLVGSDAGTDWNVTGQDRGFLSSGGVFLLEFQNFPILSGGTGADTFQIAAAGTVTGRIDGGQGQPNRLTISSGDTYWRILGLNTGIVLRASGHQVNDSAAPRVEFFQNVSNLEGSANVDTFVIEPSGRITGTIDGRGPAAVGAFDELRVVDQPATWRIDDSNAGSIDNLVPSFSNIARLTGGVLADTFILTGSRSRISQGIDGGGIPSEFNDPGALNTLIGPDVVGASFTFADVPEFFGTKDKGNVLLGGGTNFARIGNVIGGREADLFFVSLDMSGRIDGGSQTLPNSTNLLRVTGATRWELDGQDQGRLAVLDTQTSFAFQRFGLMEGTSGFADRLRVLDGGSLSGSFDGKGGGDVLEGPNLASTYLVTGLDAGRLDINGTSRKVQFLNVGSLVGGTAADSFVFGPSGNSRLSGALDGGSQAGGAATLNTLVGPDQVLTWTLGNLVDSGTVAPAAGPPLIASGFRQVGNLTGGRRADTFLLSQAGISGRIDGGPRDSSADINVIRGTVAINRTWTVNGPDSGTLTGLSGGFVNIGSLVGSAVNDTYQMAGGTLSGTIDGNGPALLDTLVNASANGAYTWEVNGANRGVLRDGAGQLVIGTAFPGTVGFSNVGNLTGNISVDTFILGANAALDGRIDGGAGETNVLKGNNLSNVARTWQLTGANAGTVNGVNLGFTRIGSLGGGLSADTFQIFPGGSLTNPTIDGGGPASLNTLQSFISSPGSWTVQSANAGVMNAGAQVVIFSNMGVLIGGPNNDSFFINAGARLDGRIDGGAPDNNLFVTDSAFWIINGFNAGLVAGIVPAFTNIQNVYGGQGQDTFKVLQGGALSGSGLIDGGGGFDTLEVDGPGTLWTLTGPESGLVTGIKDGFEEIERIVGGPGTDTFVVGNGVTFSGEVDAGDGSDTFRFVGTGRISGPFSGGAGSGDVADYSAATGALTVLIGTTGLDGFESFTGNGSTTIVGPNVPTTWTILGTNSGTVNGTAFTGATRLVGGIATDNFQLAGGTIANGVDGGGGFNTISVLYEVPLYWRIDRVNGGTVFASFSGGPDVPLIGFDNVGSLVGSAASDTFALEGGRVTGSINGGGDPSTNQVASRASSTNIWLINSPNSGTVIDQNGFTLALFGGVGNLTGGNGADDFTIFETGTLSGTIDGVGNPLTNTLTIDAPVGGATVWRLRTQNGGFIERLGFDPFTITYAGIGNLQGGSRIDAFFLEGGKVSGAIDGGGNAADNYLIQSASEPTIFAIQGRDSGVVVGLLSLNLNHFSRIGNLAGGAGNDTFNLANNASLSGEIDGGGGLNTIEIPIGVLVVADPLQPDQGVIYTLNSALQIIILVPYYRRIIIVLTYT